VVIMAIILISAAGDAWLYMTKISTPVRSLAGIEPGR